jgi:integrase
VRRGDVQRIVDRMHADGLAGSTVRNKVDPLRVLYRRALEDDQVTRNPTSHLRLPENRGKPRTVGTPERVGELLAALPDSERAVWTVAFYAGLRVGELRALRWQAVDFDAGVIRVQTGWDDVEGEQDTKTEAGTRAVPLIGRVRAELLRHQVATGRRGDDLVFGRTASEAFTRSTLRAHALKAWKTAELEPLTPHEARHCAASYFAKEGLSLKEAQEALGHADSRTTADIYQHALPGWQEQATTKLDKYLGAKVLRKSSTQPSGS